MRDYFIVSSSFIGNTFIYMLNYVLDDNIKQVKLLKENHSVDELTNISEYEIVLCDSIIDGLNSNIFIIDNNKIPIASIEYITRKVNYAQLLKIMSPWENQFQPRLKVMETENIKYRQIPTILNISIGENSQQYCTEVLLNKIFSEKEVNFIQQYSVKTRFIFEQIMGKGILNSKIALHLDKKETSNLDLIIKSIEFKDTKEFFENMENLNIYFPDFIILNVDRRFEKLKDMNDIIFHKFGCEVFIICSNYIEIQKNSLNSTYAFISAKYKDNEVNLINDINLKQKLEDSIFSRIAYPKDIKIIC